MDGVPVLTTQGPVNSQPSQNKSNSDNTEVNRIGEVSFDQGNLHSSSATVSVNRRMSPGPPTQEHSSQKSEIDINKGKKPEVSNKTDAAQETTATTSNTDTPDSNAELRSLFDTESFKARLAYANLLLSNPTTVGNSPISRQSSVHSQDKLFSDHNSDFAIMNNNLPPVVLTAAQQTEYLQHRQFLGDHSRDNRSTREEEARTAPLFSGEVMTRVPLLYNQYGLLGQELPNVSGLNMSFHSTTSTMFTDPRILLNVSAPWSAFICGQQGSGKSHTLSCLLENCLVQSPAGRLANPLSGMIFHWDRFTGYSSHQICEAAYLASSGIPVKVLVSPSNYARMKAAYENIPGITSSFQKPKVLPLLFQEKQLNVKRMLTMMGVQTDGEALPLYMEVILRLLREMALERQGQDGLNYSEFRTRLANEDFNTQQNGPLRLRLDLLESFLRTTSTSAPAIVKVKLSSSGDKKKVPAQDIKPLRTMPLTQEGELRDAWTFQPGTLTIVDLSCPFVDENAACALFAICLELFLEDRSNVGRVLALDEAHKFLNGSTGAISFTEDLLQIIRQQRHLGARVIIATQEPTISPQLLELCNFTLVHRFQSPGWFKALQSHLAGASYSSGEDSDDSDHRQADVRAKALFKKIVNLQCGQALLFASSAILGFQRSASGDQIEPIKQGMKSLLLQIRQRLTVDGGRSIMSE